MVVRFEHLDRFRQGEYCLRGDCGPHGAARQSDGEVSVTVSLLISPFEALVRLSRHAQTLRRSPCVFETPNSNALKIQDLALLDQGHTEVSRTTIDQI